MTFRFLRLRRGHCPRDAVVYPRLTGTLYHLRYELDEIFVGDFRVWTPRFGKLSREMGTRRRPLSVHALCLRAIFGYDVAEWGSVAGQIVAASMQPRCSLDAASMQAAACRFQSGWSENFPAAFRFASRLSESFGTDT